MSVRLRRARLVVGVLVSLCTVGACSTQNAHVSLPSKSASLLSVTHTYLRGAGRHDCRLTAALTLEDTFSWCSDPQLIDFKSIGQPYPDPQPRGAGSTQCVDLEVHTHGSSDQSFPSGWQPWTFCFTRTDLGWRLSDQGQG